MSIDKNLFKIVNEAINKYDFLGGGELREEQEYYDLIENEDFQKQFITDFILGKKNKYKIIETSDAQIGGDYDTDFTANQVNYITIDYCVRIEYIYDTNKKPVQFELYFENSEKVGIGIDDANEDDNNAHLNTHRFHESYITYVEWEKINVSMYSTEGDEIEFKAYKKAPLKIQKLFVREFTIDLIVNETTMEIRET